MSCLISPLSALSSASTIVRPPSKLPTTIWRVSQPAPIFRQLKLQHRRPGEMVARRPPCLVVRAQMNHGLKVKWPEHNHFVEEVGTIGRRSVEIFATVEGWLHYDGLKTSGCVCVLAAEASQLVDSGSLTDTGLSSKICEDTVQRTLGAYVDVFLSISEDCYNRTFDKDTMIRFFDALKGLASISHILLEDSRISQPHADMYPRESSLEYAFNGDVKNIYRDFNCQMDDLEDSIWNPETSKPVELVFPTINKGVELTESFLGLMVARQQRTLEKACGDSK